MKPQRQSEVFLISSKALGISEDSQEGDVAIDDDAGVS